MAYLNIVNMKKNISLILLALLAAGCTQNMPTDDYRTGCMGVKPDHIVIKRGDDRKNDHFNGYSFRNKECVFGCIWDDNDYYRLVFIEPKGRPVITHYAYAIDSQCKNNNSLIVIFSLKAKQRLVQSINCLYLRMNTCIEQYLEQSKKHRPQFFVEFNNQDAGRVAGAIQPWFVGMVNELPYYIRVRNQFIIKLKKDEVAQYEREHPDVVHMREDKVVISHKLCKYVKRNK